MDDFLEWLNTVERVFEFHEPPEAKKVKLVAIKLRRNASFWWENLKKLREREGKRKITTWDKMKKELKRKYLPIDYKQEIYHKLHNLKQKELSVDEYTAAFDHLMMQGELVEPEEQSIARYIGGLRYDIANMLQLQTYLSMNDVCRLALKIEKQLKEAKGNRYGVRDGYTRGGNSRPNLQSKVVKVDDKKETPSGGKQAAGSSTTSGRRCFKCQGLGHIASECPNRRVIAFIEEEGEEEEACDEYGQELEDDGEVAYGDQGLSIVVQRNLKVSCVVDEENWVRKNVFHTKCTSHGRVCMVIIDSGSFENVVSLEMVQKLKLETIPHPNPY